MKEVTTWHLEMNDSAELREVSDSRDMQIGECRIDQFEYNRFLYTQVGAGWEWLDKLNWNDDQWRDYVEDENLRTFVGYVGASPAGYFELQRQANSQIEIAYFGLLPAFIGKGYGGYLLSQAIKTAWASGAARVWVHTCSLDHPSARANYEARGMKLFLTEKAPV